MNVANRSHRSSALAMVAPPAHSGPLTRPGAHRGAAARDVGEFDCLAARLEGGDQLRRVRVGAAPTATGDAGAILTTGQKCFRAVSTVLYGIYKPPPATR